MADDSIAMTRDGYEKKKAELDRLQGTEMIEVTKRVASARDLGDLSENAEYHAAREEQGLNESRIRVLEHHLAKAEVREGASGGSAGIGSRVRYHDKGGDKISEVTLVHPLESNVSEGKVSVESPVGKALLDTREGDRVELETARGAKQLEIVSVS